MVKDRLYIRIFELTLLERLIRLGACICKKTEKSERQSIKEIFRMSMFKASSTYEKRLDAKGDNVNPSGLKILFR